MAKKIAVAQSTSSDVPDPGLDSLNQGLDHFEAVTTAPSAFPAMGRCGQSACRSR